MLNRQSILTALLMAASPAAYAADFEESACQRAFQALPIDPTSGIATDGTERVEEIDLKYHYLVHSDAYQAYDAACLSSFKSLKDYTRKFIDSNVGAIFVDDEPHCTGFLISEGLLLTARHCISQSPFGMLFRPFGRPSVFRKIYWKDGNRSVQDISTSYGHLDDWAIMPVETEGDDFTWPDTVFSRDVTDSQAIAIVAISIPAYVISNANSESWLDTVRFSRNDSSQIWLSTSLNLQFFKEINTDCLLHMAPTFPGASGAPLIAIHTPNHPSGTPTFSIIGLHVGNAGEPVPAEIEERSCSGNPRFNVAIKIPTGVIHR